MELWKMPGKVGYRTVSRRTHGDSDDGATRFAGALSLIDLEIRSESGVSRAGGYSEVNKRSEG